MGLVFVGTTMAPNPVTYHAGTGGHSVVAWDRDACWSKPADLNGMIASSEQFLMCGLETECPNDFVVNANAVTRAICWGGF